MEDRELKIISLNTWGGQVEGIMDFFEMNKGADVFCLQEVYSGGENDEAELKFKSESKDYNLLNNIKKILNDFDIFFYPHIKEYYGLVIFVKRDLNIVEEGEVFVHKEKGYLSKENTGFHAKNIQYIKFNIQGRDFTIINFHGLWTGKGKDDTEDRINQSQNIIDFIKTLKGEVILCGDFNLNPDTESVKMFENFGLKNLIRENGITSTRTSLYSRREVSPFADYTFVSKDLEVKSFEIMPDEVSDHSAMKLVVNV